MAYSITSNLIPFARILRMRALARAELVGRPRPIIGLFSQLSDKQKRAALNYDGPENHGPSDERHRISVALTL